jgi:hypothetical protein
MIAVCTISGELYAVLDEPPVEPSTLHEGPVKC